MRGKFVWRLLLLLIVWLAVALFGVSWPWAPIPDAPSLEAEPPAAGAVWDALAEQAAASRERWQGVALIAEGRRVAIQAGIECGLSADAAAAVWSAERRYGLPDGLLLAVIRHESNCTPWLVNVNSNGSWDGGLAQLNSGTWRWLADMTGIENPNPFDELHNIEMGAWYLAWLLDRHGNVEAALGAYNRGEAGFAAYVEAYGTTSTDYSRAVLAQWGGE